MNGKRIADYCISRKAMLKIDLLGIDVDIETWILAEYTVRDVVLFLLASWYLSRDNSIEMFRWKVHLRAVHVLSNREPL